MAPALERLPFQLFILAIIVVGCSQAIVPTYCVLPENNNQLGEMMTMYQSSEKRTCLVVSLKQLITKSSLYFESNSTIAFMPGHHFMPRNSTLHVTDVHGVLVTGLYSHTGGNSTHAVTSYAKISCQNLERSGWLFTNITDLTISGLHFSNCGISMSYKPAFNGQVFRKSATLLVANVTNMVLYQVQVENGLGYGLYGVNILGCSNISQTHFLNNTQGGNSFIEYVDFSYNVICLSIHHLLIQNSTFKEGEAILRLTSPVSDTGAGLSVSLRQTTFSVNITLLHTYAINNKARKGPNFQFKSISSTPNIIMVSNSTASHGTVLFSGGSGFEFSYTQLFSSNLQPCRASGIPARASIKLINSWFVDSKGEDDPSYLNEFTSNAVGMVFFLLDSSCVPHDVSIMNCDISNNIGGAGVGLFSQIVAAYENNKDKIRMEIVNSSFVNNTSTSYRTNQLSTIYLVHINSVKIFNITVSNNTGTGLLSDGSHIYFNGHNTFENNSAFNGGGLALYGSSFIYLKPYTSIRFIGNAVENVGGGIYVAKTVDATVKSQCFFQYYNITLGSRDVYKVEFCFENNTAGLTGNDLFGGSLENCLTNQVELGWQVFPFISGLSRNGEIPDVSSKPTRVCLCNETTGEPNCPKFFHSIDVYPGSLFNISAIAVGQMLFYHPAGMPTAIYATLLENIDSGRQSMRGTIPDEMTTQEAKRDCTILTYRVNSINKHEVIALTVERSHELQQRDRKLINKAKYWFTDNSEVLAIFSEIPVYINVTFLPCPLGFELSPFGACDCARSFKKQKIACDIDAKTILRISPRWIGTKSPSFTTTNDSTPVYIMHSNCPYDYCIFDNIQLHLNDSDVQCAFNRSGTLCGACKDGLSAVFGGSECKRCSNDYILLLIIFAVAGVLLVFLLIATNMTVTVGTINGLLFYANIIGEYQSVYFPTKTDVNVLTVFIAWLNLDFGINSCFYNGMDTYAKSLMQFLFPMYIWLLTAVIIVTSHYLSRIAKLCGKNIVQVLATLFLLSHTKLQRAIITGLTFTILTQSNNHTEVVWLPDPTLKYLHGKHIFLFVASIAVFLFLFLPYTLTILCGPCLLSRSNYKVFSCVQRLKPMFDAYFGPYKDKYRYWTGLLLFVRMLLVVLSAVNVFGDPGINLLATIIISYVLSILVWQSGGVYKVWILTAIESFFFLNIGLLSTVTMYIRVSGGNQFVATHLSSGIAFVVFLAVLLYHIIVCTPLNVLERSCFISFKTFVCKFGLWQKFQKTFLNQDTEQNTDSHTDEFDLVETSDDPDLHEEDSSTNVNWDSDSMYLPENTREVSSMLISFNALKEPTFEFGTVCR